jgi:hypothetical protein
MPWELSESLWKNDTAFYLVLFSVYFLCVTSPSGTRREDGVTNFSLIAKTNYTVTPSSRRGPLGID